MYRRRLQRIYRKIITKEGDRLCFINDRYSPLHDNKYKIGKGKHTHTRIYTYGCVCIKEKENHFNI